ncbi:Cell death protease, partial [Chytridiales sp. JEL 0842]
MLYVEQPVGTGFSFTTGSLPRNEFDLRDHFYTFMSNFMKTFTWAVEYDLYITGESYAGVYIPYIGDKFAKEGIWQDGTTINLKGLGIGNGLIDWLNQISYPGVKNDADYLSEINFFGSDVEAQKEANRIGNLCITATRANSSSIPYRCDLFQYAADWRRNRSGEGCVDIYNIDRDCKHFNAKDAALREYFNLPDVRRSLHVHTLLPPNSTAHNSTWLECSPFIPQQLLDNVPTPIEILPTVLHLGIPVLLFTGDRDFICHYVGIERAIGNMTWNQSTGFPNPFAPWNVTDPHAPGAGSVQKGL